MDQDNINLGIPPFFMRDELFFFIGRACTPTELFEEWTCNFTPYKNYIRVSGKGFSEVLSFLEEEPLFCGVDKKGDIIVFIRCGAIDGKDVVLLDSFFSRFRGLRTHKWFSLSKAEDERVDLLVFFKERESVSARYLSDIWQKSSHLRI